MVALRRTYFISETFCEDRNENFEHCRFRTLFALHTRAAYKENVLYFPFTHVHFRYYTFRLLISISVTQHI